MLTALIFLSIILIGSLGWTLTRLIEKNKIIAAQKSEITQQLDALKFKSQELADLFQEKQQIIGVVSHDLKGPFNRIFALVHLLSLSSENLTSDQVEYLGKIHQIVADGLGMMRNLLDNRRLEEKGVDLANEKINLTNLIGGLAKNYQVLAEKKGIELRADLAEESLITGDKLYLTRVFENLFSNALKFSEAGKHIWIKLKDKTDLYEISVEDNGPGLSAEDQAMLYQKMQRLTPRPTGGESSTGLGLWIVKTILDKMDGEILCESELGKGTVFKVRLKKSILS